MESWQLLRGRGSRLVGFLTLYTGSATEAEDLAQSAIEWLCAAWPSKKIQNPRAWLRRVSINLATSRWRRAVLFRRRAPLLVTSDETSHESETAQRVATRRALASLDHRERARCCAGTTRTCP